MSCGPKPKSCESIHSAFRPFGQDGLRPETSNHGEETMSSLAEKRNDTLKHHYQFGYSVWPVFGQINIDVGSYGYFQDGVWKHMRACTQFNGGSVKLANYGYDTLTTGQVSLTSDAALSMGFHADASQVGGGRGKAGAEFSTNSSFICRAPSYRSHGVQDVHGFGEAVYDAVKKDDYNKG